MALRHRDRAPKWDGRHLPDQQGRTFVVTGAGGGLGLSATRRLAKAGAHVIMAVRSVDKAEDAAAQLRREQPSGTVEVRRLDVASLASVRSFADTVERVDVLINNAGVMALPPTRSVDGFEMQMATNHLGHFALTNLLLPKLSDRVVVVGSAAHRSGNIDPSDLNYHRTPYHRYGAYANSKLANLLFLSELQRRFTEAGRTQRAVAGHPGYSSTGIVGSTGLRAFSALSELGNRLIGMHPDQGALPVLFVATMDVPGNSYLGPHGPAELRGYPVHVGRSRRAGDPDLARRVWQVSEELTGTTFPFA